MKSISAQQNLISEGLSYLLHVNSIGLSPKFRLAKRKQNDGKTKPKMVKQYIKKSYRYPQLMTKVNPFAHV